MPGIHNPRRAIPVRFDVPPHSRLECRVEHCGFRPYVEPTLLDEATTTQLLRALVRRLEEDPLMLSPTTIRSMQQDAAAQAARERRVPFIYWPGDKLGPPFPFPNLGDYVPEGWQRVDSFMVDSSGFGGPNEPADTPEQLRARIEREVEKYAGQTVGWAIIEVGQFQVVLGEFVKADQPGAKRDQFDDGHWPEVH